MYEGELSKARFNFPEPECQLPFPVPKETREVGGSTSVTLHLESPNGPEWRINSVPFSAKSVFAIHHDSRPSEVDTVFHTFSIGALIITTSTISGRVFGEFISPFGVILL